jgi:hypothetical protein
MVAWTVALHAHQAASSTTLAQRSLINARNALHVFHLLLDLFPGALAEPLATVLQALIRSFVDLFSFAKNVQKTLIVLQLMLIQWKHVSYVLPIQSTM